jgi:hypothetical protein
MIKLKCGKDLEQLGIRGFEGLNISLFLLYTLKVRPKGIFEVSCSCDIQLLNLLSSGVGVRRAGCAPGRGYAGKG